MKFKWTVQNGETQIITKEKALEIIEHGLIEKDETLTVVET